MRRSGALPVPALVPALVLLLPVLDRLLPVLDRLPGTEACFLDFLVLSLPEPFSTACAQPTIEINFYINIIIIIIIIIHELISGPCHKRIES